MKDCFRFVFIFLAILAIGIEAYKIIPLLLTQIIPPVGIVLGIGYIAKKLFG